MSPNLLGMLAVRCIEGDGATSGGCDWGDDPAGDADKGVGKFVIAGKPARVSDDYVWLEQVDLLANRFCAEPAGKFLTPDFIGCQPVQVKEVNVRVVGNRSDVIASQPAVGIEAFDES